MKRSAEGSRRSDTTIKLIGVFKFVKVAILLTLGIVALVGAPDSIGHALAHFTRWTGAFSGREIVQRFLARLLAVNERTMHRIGIGSLIYAAVFATEGTGLLLERRWGEWLTVGVTGSFIPLEIYELVHRPGLGKVAALTLNLAIAAYLLRRLSATRKR